MKVFVTGIAGFVGSAVAEFMLKQRWKVFGVDNLFTGQAGNLSPDIQWIEADIRETSTFTGLPHDFDIIIHLAAQTSGEKSFELPCYDMDTNIRGTYNVYQFAKTCRVGLMINMSSMSVYGDVHDMAVVDEDRQPSPVSLYGNSKLAAETMVNLLSDVDRMPVISLRLFNAYGPRQNLDEMKQGMVSIFLSYLLNHDKIVVKGSLDRIRDFIYIDDIVSALMSIVESEYYTSGIYNLSSGDVLTVGELIDSLKKISGIDKEVVCEGHTLGDISGFGGSNRKLVSKFGWKPKFQLSAGLERMINFYKAQNSL
ncbi:MAG: NAD-dependent epimerase/dehydratase family protein [Planctomycetes bacterium]|nr:NAD-dependent epimerase/dehydratase family protein [Planctomycetota bacterium]